MKLLTLDCETTGTNRTTDQVIEVGFVTLDGEDQRTFVQRIRPEVDISPGAYRIHGISMEDLKDAPLFREEAHRFAQTLRWADAIAGYNVRFDLDILLRQLNESGHPVDMSATLLFDPHRLWAAMEPRGLAAAHQRFVGEPIQNAHQALADAEATLSVWQAMVSTFGLEDKTGEELAKLCFPEFARRINGSDHFAWESGRAMVSFGKYRGTSIHEVLRTSDYLGWMRRQDFPPQTKAVIDFCLEIGQKKVPEPEFSAAVATRFGSPPAEEAQE